MFGPHGVSVTSCKPTSKFGIHLTVVFKTLFFTRCLFQREIHFFPPQKLIIFVVLWIIYFFIEISTHQHFQITTQSLCLHLVLFANHLKFLFLISWSFYQWELGVYIWFNFSDIKLCKPETLILFLPHRYSLTCWVLEYFLFIFQISGMCHSLEWFPIYWLDI